MPSFSPTFGIQLLIKIQKQTYKQGDYKMNLFLLYSGESSVYLSFHHSESLWWYSNSNLNENQTTVQPSTKGEEECSIKQKTEVLLFAIWRKNDFWRENPDAHISGTRRRVIVSAFTKIF